MNQAYGLPFKRIGKDVVIWDRARIVTPEVISIGDSVIIDDFVFLMGGQKTVIGSFVHIAAFSSLVGGGTLVMEDFSGLSGGCRLYTGNEDYLGTSLTNPAVPYPFRRAERSTVVIKKHAIVGANTVVLAGVTINEGVAIGANSLVRETCEAWTIYVGSPARPIRKRPKDRILMLEQELRKKLYDNLGYYIPVSEREESLV